MNFNKHSRLEGAHAFLGASKYHWVNYSDEKLVNSYMNFQAVQRGTELHSFAKQAIDLGIRLPNTKQTLNKYVNDAIGFQMDTEVVLYYSDNCFGTADAISFKKNLLRIHDYKSGVTPASMRQLEIYAAIFCLEYGFKPNAINMELRIYQSDEVLIHEPNKEDIAYIMDRIITADMIIEKVKIGE